MCAKRLPYREGSVFLAPLESGQFARGVVARSGPRGRVLLGYFFGPAINADEASVQLKPQDAILRIRFGDLGLIRNEWKVIGAIEPWLREDWPIPEFLWTDPLGRIPDKVVVYQDEDFETGGIGREESRSVIPSGLERNSSSGSRAVEIKLSRLLA